MSYLLFSKEQAKSYALNKRNYISVSLKNISAKTMRQELMRPAQKSPAAKKKQIKRKSVDAVSEDIDVDSLFDNVWTKKVQPQVHKKKKIDIKRIQEIQKSVAIGETGAVQMPKQSPKAQEEKSKNAEGSAGEEVNEYSAKIHAIVYEHFYPPANTQGQVVRAVIELSPLGKVLDFRILDYSASEALNKEADRIKQRIKNVIFPKNPDNETARVLVILKPEAKE